MSLKKKAQKNANSGGKDQTGQTDQTGSRDSGRDESVNEKETAKDGKGEDGNDGNGNGKDGKPTDGIGGKAGKDGKIVADSYGSGSGSGSGRYESILLYPYSTPTLPLLYPYSTPTPYPGFEVPPRHLLHHAGQLQSADGKNQNEGFSVRMEVFL